MGDAFDHERDREHRERQREELAKKLLLSWLSSLSVEERLSKIEQALVRSSMTSPDLLMFVDILSEGMHR